MRRYSVTHRDVRVPGVRGKRRWHVLIAGVVLAVVALLVGAGVGQTRSGGPRSENGDSAAVPEIVVLSNRADLVSGGDALVEVRVPKGADPHDVRVELNGRDVTGQFAVRPNGRFQGLLEGLIEGKNSLVAEVKKGSGSSGATLTVTNYSKQGPIFSGPQIEPYICETQLLGLGLSSPPKCEAPTRYELFYKRAGSGPNDAFVAYDPAAPPPPSEVATTNTDQGKRVPFIVRRERGVINRAVYDIAVLYQPGQEWQPWSPQPGWNGKLLIVFNGGTKTFHRQAINGSIPDVFFAAIAGRPFGHISSHSGGDIALARGFAVATSTTSQVDNPVTSTETAMMVKEHLIESYGPVRYTIGIGCSGGSMMQHLTANNYPGLLDGVIALCPLADMWTVIMNHAAHDYPLLIHYFNHVSPQLWPDKKARMAVYGGVDADSSAIASNDVPNWFRSAAGCTASSAADEAEWVYDPVRNPTGVRCALQEDETQILGTRPPSVWGPIERKIGRGFTNRPVDNVGVQYGLEALKRGQISPEQFVDLNLKVGGVDIDGNWAAQRTEADRDGLRNLYRSGQVDEAGQLANVPMVHVHTYTPLDLFHPLIATEMMRKRLVAANGNADNLVRFVTVDDQLTGLAATLGSEKSYAMRRAAFLTLDKWLAGIEADHSNAPLADKVRRNKPAEATDTCWANDQPGAQCPEPFLYPKMVAGGPIASDIQKCQLKPIDWNEYGSVHFTSEQQQQLRQAFPQGVCDWSKPRVEQQPPAGVWLTFADTIGGRPLGPPPRSQPTHKSLSSSPQGINF